MIAMRTGREWQLEMHAKARSRSKESANLRPDFNNLEVQVIG
jgi:hypothetical protein